MDQKTILSILSLLMFAGCVCGPVCNAPYLRVGNGCCLDRNGNGVCDTDETTTTTQAMIEVLPMPDATLPEYIRSQCSGRLISVYADRIWLYTGEKIKITASFRNEGNISNIPILLRLKAMLDGSPVSILETEGIRSNSGQTLNMTTNVVLFQPGRYEIIGSVDYCDKTSEERSTILNVNDAKLRPDAEDAEKNQTRKKINWTSFTRPAG